MTFTSDEEIIEKSLGLLGVFDSCIVSPSSVFCNDGTFTRHKSCVVTIFHANGVDLRPVAHPWGYFGLSKAVPLAPIS